MAMFLGTNRVAVTNEGGGGTSYEVLQFTDNNNGSYVSNKTILQIYQQTTPQAIVINSTDFPLLESQRYAQNKPYALIARYYDSENEDYSLYFNLVEEVDSYNWDLNLDISQWGYADDHVQLSYAGEE